MENKKLKTILIELYENRLKVAIKNEYYLLADKYKHILNNLKKTDLK